MKDANPTGEVDTNFWNTNLPDCGTAACFYFKSPRLLLFKVSCKMKLIFCARGADEWILLLLCYGADICSYLIKVIGESKTTQQPASLCRRALRAGDLLTIKAEVLGQVLGLGTKQFKQCAA